MSVSGEGRSRSGNLSLRCCGLGSEALEPGGAGVGQFCVCVLAMVGEVELCVISAPVGGKG